MQMTEWNHREAVVFVDGRQASNRQAILPWDDPGLTRGLGAFETLPILDGRPLHLEEHLHRLEQSCGLLGLPAPDLHRLAFQTQMAMATGGAPEGVLRIQITAGGRQIIGIRPAGLRRTETTAHRLVWPSPPFPSARAKHTSRAGYSLAPRRHGVDEVIRTTADGHALEGTWSSVFCLRAGSLYTCPDDGRILPGVTRAKVLSIASQQGVPVIEEPPSPPERGDDWFLTSSLHGMVPIHELDGRRCSPTGPISRALGAALDRACGRAPLPEAS